ncbi:MAG TPA: NUMOD4 domain-containing protein [Coleofasciculaceae cyanobacterium]
MTEEIWKDVQGYEGFYQVSNLGKVKRLETGVLGRSNCVRIQPERILKSHPTTKGYLLVQLSVESKIKAFTVHRLVAGAFLSRPDSDCLDVNHINGVKTDNRLVNLEWVTKSQNTVHAIKNNLMSGVMGKGLTSDDTIEKIAKMLEEGFSKSEIARRLKVSRHTINKYCGYQYPR